MQNSFVQPYLPKKDRTNGKVFTTQKFAQECTELLKIGNIEKIIQYELFLICLFHKKNKIRSILILYICKTNYDWRVTITSSITSLFIWQISQKQKIIQQNRTELIPFNQCTSENYKVLDFHLQGVTTPDPNTTGMYAHVGDFSLIGDPLTVLEPQILHNAVFFKSQNPGKASVCFN